ncbi:uncharacterized protein DUF2871 [Propionibacteriaceae bacterium ES.041]|uniref:DUF2871 domain-containing protein n=1 Tax=Enemella evansiae TaxID=2016499 RepID=UPI000B96F317|nr:DUF2871 domain-containing protein [Enemella evansiae]OYO15144.1 hypothetical protein CGZ98_01480 [Enemella evansiae]PFG66819.1 uncharacterized protein DUF2871 [Propionibacteriaceae bacterium ES.041]
MKKLYASAALYTVLGLAAGLYYRELTRSHAFTGDSQLGLAHTHFLTLGTLVLLLVLALEQVFRLSGSRAFGWFLGLWNAGVLITGGMMLVRGTFTVLGEPLTSKAFAGIAGLGHMLLTAGFVLLFVALWRRLPDRSLQPADRGAAMAASVTGPR